MRHDHLLRAGGKRGARFKDGMWRKFEIVQCGQWDRTYQENIVGLICNLGGTGEVDRHRFRQH